MKVIIHESANPERPYPKLMKEKGGGAIVFFENPGYGMVLRKSTEFPENMIIRENPSHFEDFFGEVILSND